MTSTPRHSEAAFETVIEQHFLDGKERLLQVVNERAEWLSDLRVGAAG